MCTDALEENVGFRTYIHADFVFTLLVSFLFPPPTTRERGLFAAGNLLLCVVVARRIRYWCVACSGWQTSRNSGSVRTKLLYHAAGASATLELRAAARTETECLR